MAARSSIEWTDTTWNPVTGCTKVSPGCDHCYAETFAERWRGTSGHHFEDGFDIVLRPERLTLPLRWRRSRRIFVNSMSDLFHDQVADEFIARVFAVMAVAERHTFQVLTKRHGRMRSLLRSAAFGELVLKHAPLVAMRVGLDPTWAARMANPDDGPLPNVWLGVSAEDQKRADIRIPALLDTPAAVRFVSAEPLLGPIDLKQAVIRMGDQRGHGLTASYVHTAGCCARFHGIDWVIAGGESGPKAHPMHPDWARNLRDQSTRAGIPFFFKQWGEYLPVPVEDNPRFAGGRAFDNPRGGRSSATIRERSTHPFAPGITRLLRAGDINGHGHMLDNDTIAVRVGKKTSGRLLDGRTWTQFPPRPGRRLRHADAV